MNDTSVPQVASPLEPARDVAASVWYDRLAWHLISGFAVDDAIDRCHADGVAEPVIRAAVDSIVRNPLFRVAALHTTRLKSRDWMFDAYAKLADIRRDSSVVDTRECLSREEFIDGYYVRNRAVVLRGLAASWPAVALWSDAAYLTKACEGLKVEIMVGRDAARIADQNTAARLRRPVAWAEYVKLVFSLHEGNDCYMVSRNRFFSEPTARALLNDVLVPPYVQLDDCGNDVRLWFGPNGTYTALHQDDVNNLFVQVFGRKIVRMYPPYCASIMGQSSLWYAGTDPGAVTGMEDESGLRRLETTLQLEPGDALFIPVGWWHAVRAVGPSATLSFFNFGVPNRYPVVWTY